jgi:hypothetical protein
VGVLVGGLLVEVVTELTELVVDVEMPVSVVEGEVGTTTLVLELEVALSVDETEVEVGTVTLVLELEVALSVDETEVEVGTATLVLLLVELDVDIAMQLQALLTRPATSPPQAATAYDGIALVAATTAVVKAAQNA